MKVKYITFFLRTIVLGICVLNNNDGVYAHFNLTVLHVNDIHARIEQTNKYTGYCEKEDAGNNTCYGGIARLATAIKEIRAKEKNVILLNAGDIFQGTVWYSEYKWVQMAKFTNILNITAASLGNHEFDDGINGLRPFIKNTDYPLLCANCDFAKYPDLVGSKSNRGIKPYEVINIEGENGKQTKIGIIGYLTTDTPDVSETEEVGFLDEVNSITKIVTKLRENGIDIIIALGHSGFEMDKKIAKEVDGIDLVVGGHSNTFLYTGNPPMVDGRTIEKPEQVYPFIVKRKNQDVPVVTAYKYSKYLGHLKLRVENGKVIPLEGSNPILLDKTYKQDEAVMKEIRPLKQQLEEKGNIVVGYTNVYLNNTQDASRERETNIGNFVADSMLYEYMANLDKYKIIPTIALVNGGGIRGSVDKGKIKTRQLASLFPFGNNLVVVTMKGKDLREMLEHSASFLDKCGKNKRGGFIQVSGIKVTIDLNKPKKERVTSVMVWKNWESKESCRELEDEKDYNIVMYDFLAYGGDKFTDLRTKKYKINQGPLDMDAVNRYVKAHNPINTKEEGRLEIIKACGGKKTASNIRGKETHAKGICRTILKRVEDTQSSISSADTATPIIIVVVLLVVLVALVGLFLYWKRQRREYSDENGEDEEEAADLNIVKNKTDNLK